MYYNKYVIQSFISEIKEMDSMLSDGLKGGWVHLDGWSGKTAGVRLDDLREILWDLKVPLHADAAS